MTKKAQAWGTDLAIGFMIFSAAIVFFYFYSFNYTNETEDMLQILTYEGNYIADAIMSSGSPTDWTNETVQEIGIEDDGKINETKFERFFNLTQSDYNKTKTLFQTRYDYYFFLKNESIMGSEGIGKPGTNSTNIQASNLIKVTRFTIYKNKPTTVYLYIFEP